MNYIILADYLWYSGHILSGLSIIFTHTNNYNIAIGLVFIGQFITIISRPISRMKSFNDTDIDNTDIDNNSIESNMV